MFIQTACQNTVTYARGQDQEVNSVDTLQKSDLPLSFAAAFTQPTLKLFAEWRRSTIGPRGSTPV